MRNRRMDGSETSGVRDQVHAMIACWLRDKKEQCILLEVDLMEQRGDISLKSDVTLAEHVRCTGQSARCEAAGKGSSTGACRTGRSSSPRTPVIPITTTGATPRQGPLYQTRGASSSAFLTRVAIFELQAALPSLSFCSSSFSQTVKRSAHSLNADHSLHKELQIMHGFL